MNWTEDKPFMDGWYWWRHPLHKDESIAKVTAGRAEFVGDEHIYNLSILKGEWFGPMVVPCSTPPPRTYEQDHFADVNKMVSGTYEQAAEDMRERAVAILNKNQTDGCMCEGCRTLRFVMKAIRALPTQPSNDLASVAPITSFAEYTKSLPTQPEGERVKAYEKMRDLKMALQAILPEVGYSHMTLEELVEEVRLGNGAAPLIIQARKALDD